MLPQTIELVAATNSIHSSAPVNEDVNALSSPVLSAGGATLLQLSWTNAATITIEGLDADGNFQTETVSTPAGISTVGYYTSVTSVVPDADVTALVVSYLGGASTATIPVNWRQTPFNMAMGASQSAGAFTEKITYQFSLDAPNRDFAGSFANDTTWFDVNTGGTLSVPPAAFELNAPAQAMRAIINGVAPQTWLVRFVQGDNPQ